MKRLLKRPTDSGEDLYLAILNYRASPLENGLSPASMLMKRKLRTRLPSAKSRMENSASHNHKECQINAYNKIAVPLKPLAQEEIVRVRCDGQWGPLAKVIKVTAPRSYEVITEHGQTLPQNRRQLLKVPQENMKIMDSNIRDVTLQGQREQQEMTKQPNVTKQPDETSVQEKTVNIESKDMTQVEKPKEVD